MISQNFTLQKMLKSIRKSCYKIRIWISITLFLIIFWNICKLFIDKWIVPFVSTIPDNNLLIAICFFLISLLIILFWIVDLGKQEYLHYRYLFEIDFIAIYCILKKSGEYVFYSYAGCEYVWCLAVPLLLGELSFLIYKFKKRKHLKEVDIYGFYTDTPTKEDDYERGHYASMLAHKIIKTFVLNNQNRVEYRGAFVINIGEEYGYGKTSFLLLLENKLKEEYEGQYIAIQYRPWLCESETAILTELFNLLSEELKPYFCNIDKQIQNYVNGLLESTKYGNVVSRLFGYKRPSLKKEHDEIKKVISKIKIPIIVFIDDVDRLQNNELMVLLNLVRDTADFENIFYIMAADKQYLVDSLRSSGIKKPEEFLKKFINYDFLLPANDNIIIKQLKIQLQDIFKRFIDEKSECKRIIQNILNLPQLDRTFCNMRDVYRFLNSYLFVLDLMNDNNKEDGRIDYADLFALTLIQYLRPDIYKILRDNDSRLLNLNGDRYFFKYMNDMYPGKEFEQGLKDILEDIKGEKTPQTITYKKMDEILEESQQAKEEVIVGLLRYLFATNSREKNRLYHKESYFKYFSTKLRQKQISDGEVLRLLEINESEYSLEIAKIIREGKIDSFVSKLRSFSEEWKYKIEMVRKLYILIHQYINISQEENISNIEKENKCFDDFGISFILYNLYQTREESSNENENADALKNFVLDDKHINFSALILFALDGKYSHKLLVSQNDLLEWRRDLINLFIQRYIRSNENPFKDEILDMIPNLRGNFDNGPWAQSFASYLKEIPNYMDWFIPLVTIGKGKMAWNGKYMKQMGFDSYRNLTVLLQDCGYMNQDERLMDLQKLFSLPDLNIRTDNKHPFLEYVRSINKSDK